MVIKIKIKKTKKTFVSVEEGSSLRILPKMFIIYIMRLYPKQQDYLNFLVFRKASNSVRKFFLSS